MEKETTNFKEFLLVILTFGLPMLLYNYISVIFLPLISLIAIYLFFYMTHKKITNVIFFTSLLLLLSVAFPMTHFFAYKINKANYKFENDFLNIKSQAFKDELKDKIDTNFLCEILSYDKPFLRLDRQKLNTEKLYRENNFIFQYQIFGHAETRRSYISIYDTSGNKLTKIKFTESNIKECILKEFNELRQLTNYRMHPSENISLNDFWVESITAFAIGNIKSNSNIVLIIRGLQFITAFIFFTILSNTMKSMDLFVLRKKQ